MWSVIIPTLWRSNLTQLLLKDLLENPLIGEVIVVDNAPKSRPILNLESNKLVILEQDSNIFVNQAWNLGVHISRFEKICICNDDVNFNSSALFCELSNLHFKDYILGCHSHCFNDFVKNINCTFIDGHSIGDGWGCILFFRKSNFVEIPNALKIFFGDDWLALKFPRVKSFIFPLITNMSSTSSLEEFQIKIKSDYTSFNQLLSVFEKFFIKYSHVNKYNGFFRFNLKIIIKLIYILRLRTFNSNHF
jgi:hypothetical protein